MHFLMRPYHFLYDKFGKDKILILINDLGLAYGLADGFRLRWQAVSSGRSLWLDTVALANNVTTRSYSNLFTQLDNGQSAPAGFLILTKFIGSLFHYNEYALLLLPLFFGIASMLLFTFLSLQVLGRKAAYIAVVIFSLSSSTIYYSAEYKQYSGDIFFTVLLLWLASLAIQKNFSNRSLMSLGVTGLLAILFSHAMLFIIPGISLGLLYSIYTNKKNHSASKKILLLLAIWLAYYVVIFFLVIKPLVQPDVYSYFSAGFAPFPPSSLSDIQWYINLITGVIRHPLGFSKVFAIPFVCMVVGVGVFFKKTDRTIGVILFSPLLFLLVASIIKKYPVITGISEVDARLILFVVPILSLCIAKGAWFLVGRKSLFIYGAFILILLSSQLLLPSYPLQREDTKPLIEYIYNHKLSDDTIYVYDFTVPAFQYYTRERPMNYLPFRTSAPDYAQQFTIQSHHGRLWLIFSHNNEADERPILDYLGTQAQKIDEYHTDGASLYLYQY